MSSRNLEAPDAHQRASTPQGLERGRTGANPSARNPATLPLWSPQQAAGRTPASVRGPWSAIAVARCPLAGGPTVPQDWHRPPGRPYSMFRYNAHLRKQRPSSPPILGGEETYWEGRRDASSPPVLKSAMRRAQARAPGRAGRRARARRGGRGRPRHG